MAHPPIRLLIPLAVIAALGTGGWYIDARRSEERSTLSGFFESQPADLASRIGGRVAEIRVEEGQDVRQGQPLVILEAEPNRQETKAREAQARQAAAALSEVEHGPRVEDIRRQEAAVAEARAALARLRNGPLPEEIEQARARLRQAQARLARLMAGARPQEIEEARAAERVAAARLAAAERGPTPEERAQFKARRDAAATREALAAADRRRAEDLFDQGAIARQSLDQARTAHEAASAQTAEAEEALRRAERGTPAEELAQAREAHRQARAALNLVLAGAHPQDIAAARAEAAATREALRLLERGARAEDIRAGEARLAQAQAVLQQLRAGSRREQVQQAQAALRAATATAQASRTNTADRVVRAPAAGSVERVLVARGDLISPGSPVLRIATPQDIWIRVYIAEERLAGVHVGDAATLRVDGIDAPVEAKVESIATRGEFTPANLQTPEERGKQVFGVRLRPRRSDDRIKAGMYATVTALGGKPL